MTIRTEKFTIVKSKDGGYHSNPKMSLRKVDITRLDNVKNLVEVVWQQEATLEEVKAMFKRLINEQHEAMIKKHGKKVGEEWRAIIVYNEQGELEFSEI